MVTVRWRKGGWYFGTVVKKKRMADVSSKDPKDLEISSFTCQVNLSPINRMNKTERVKDSNEENLTKRHLHSVLQF